MFYQLPADTPGAIALPTLGVCMTSHTAQQRSAEKRMFYGLNFLKNDQCLYPSTVLTYFRPI